MRDFTFVYSIYKHLCRIMWQTVALEMFKYFENLLSEHDHTLANYSAKGHVSNIALHSNPILCDLLIDMERG